MLFCLAELASESSFEGFNLENIKSDLYRIGVSNHEIMKIIKQLIDSGAIRTADGNPIQDDSLILPTRLGGYLVFKLCFAFMYFEPCLIDSCIYDDDTWNLLVDITEKVDSSTQMKRINFRIERANIYLQYLKNIEQNWIVNCKRFNLQGYWSKEIISTVIIPKADRQFKWVLRSAENQYKQNSLYKTYEDKI